MMSFLDAIACVISRTTHALDVITSISRYDRRSNLLHFFLDNVEKFCRPGHGPDDNIIPLMRIACWIPKATDTRSERVTLIAFPLHQWLHERASVLRYTYIARFVYISCDVVDI